MENVRTTSALGIASLLGVRGLGPTTALKIADGFATFGDVMAAGPDGLKGFASAPIREALAGGGSALRDSHAAALEADEESRSQGIVSLTPWDEAYPRRLLSIPDRPLVIHALGDLSVLERSVACVGSREPTRFGEAVAERFTTMLGDGGWTVVSGLARGVDSICHRTALERGTPTAAVLGSGLGALSSTTALEIAERILEAGGAVLSEQPQHKESDPSSLIRRNRIITGVSVATFFVQAGMESGTMHSVKYAALQHRPVYVPGIPAAFAGEELNQAAMCMARMEPAQFAMAIDAKPTVAEAMAAIGRPHLGIEIAGRDAYPQTLASLEALVEAERTAGPVTPAP